VGGVALTAGQVVWCDLEPAVGREQGGRRPCVVISSTDFSDVIDELIVVVPCTSRERGWLSRIPLSGPTGLARLTFAITEQPRTMSVSRVHGLAGFVDSECLTEISRWVSVWLHPAA
jgi:mRNA interferase MazF